MYSCFLRLLADQVIKQKSGKKTYFKCQNFENLQQIVNEADAEFCH